MTSAVPSPLVPVGGAHLAALGVVVALAGGLAGLVHVRPRLGVAVRLSLAAALTGLVVFELTIGAREGWLGWKNVLPLELCDAALVLSILTLLWPQRATAELVYFWTGSGTLLAMLTPDLAWDFPRWEFVVFFGLHGLALASALVLVFGLGLHPRRGAPLRVLAVTVAWAGFVSLVNWGLGTNFMYLRQKPGVATPLDWMGPWPVYIAVGAALALALFELLALPFRREWRKARVR
jgi:hypothetical integral membrane protein (TIGR02206 family)